MRITLCSVMALTLWGAVVGYPNIAPRQACYSMRPSHRYRAQTSTAPFQIEIHQSDGTYRAGRDVQVSIRSTGPRRFRGFLLQARTDSGDTVGTWIAFNSRRYGTQVTCDNTALTHNSPNDKTLIVGKWRPPVTQAGPIFFQATIVQNFENFWQNVKSTHLTPAINDNLANKSQWPELIGKTGEEAKAQILRERPGLAVHIVPINSVVTLEFRSNRVRIFVDRQGKVSRTPSVG